MEFFIPFLDIGVDWIADVLQSEVAKMTIAFMVAARLHRRWVKKDMAEHFSKITTSIDRVAVTLAGDLESHRKMVGGLELKVEDLNDKVVELDGRVSVLEQKPKEGYHA